MIMTPNRSNYRQREERRRELGITGRELRALKERKRAGEGVLKGEGDMTYSVAIE